MNGRPAKGGKKAHRRRVVAAMDCDFQTPVFLCPEVLTSQTPRKTRSIARAFTGPKVSWEAATAMSDAVTGWR